MLFGDNDDFESDKKKQFRNQLQIKRKTSFLNILTLSSLYLNNISNNYFRFYFVKSRKIFI